MIAAFGVTDEVPGSALAARATWCLLAALCTGAHPDEKRTEEIGKPAPYGRPRFLAAHRGVRCPAGELRLQGSRRPAGFGSGGSGGDSGRA